MAKLIEAFSGNIEKYFPFLARRPNFATKERRAREEICILMTFCVRRTELQSIVRLARELEECIQTISRFRAKHSGNSQSIFLLLQHDRECDSQKERRMAEPRLVMKRSEITITMSKYDVRILCSLLNGTAHERGTKS
jgi:hypothetical protein